MLDYLIFIVVTDVVALAIMSLITTQNQLISKESKSKFKFTYFLICLVSILELISVIVNGLDNSYRYINILSNLLCFFLTPFVSIMLGWSIMKPKHLKILAICYLIYGLFLIISMPNALVFGVDANNQYFRGPAYYVYILAYTLSTIYYLVLVYKVGRKYQNQSIKIIVVLMAFFFIETSIQVINPNILLSWMCMSLLAMINYIYFNTLWQQIDGLTGLLNQHSYLKAVEYNHHPGIMVFMDVNDFKKINDYYGHALGNDVLVILANIIKNVYGNDGTCYRVGGDEFLILLNSNTDYNKLNDQLQRKIEEQKLLYEYFPNVSIGCMRYGADDDLNHIFMRADHKMYLNKPSK